MKTLKLLIFSLLFPLVFHAQKSLTGLWVGTLDNDSATVRKDQAFEIALTEYRGKVYGYSRMTFTVNDTLYYIIKRVKGSIDGETCQVKDDEIIRHNFPRQPDKGVKLISTFRRNLEDSIWKLDGDWKTTESKRHRYYSISGKISLSSEPDLSKSKLFPHLEELNLDKDVAFYTAAKKEAVNYQDNGPAPSLAQSDKEHNEKDQSGGEAPVSASLKKTDAPVSSLVVQTKNIDNNLQKPGVSKGSLSVRPKEHEQTMEQALAATSLKKTTVPVSSLSLSENKNLSKPVGKPEITVTELPVKVNELGSVTQDAGSSSLKDGGTAAVAPHDPVKDLSNTTTPVVRQTGLATLIGQRKQAAPQYVEFKSDSLVIKLYDNGEIDGDTVSVLLNGEILLASQGLKASAIKKTIYVQPGQEEMTLVLYAENLGKYPPNTGLLVINDGDATYQLRFSADLQQNAAVVFKRKK